MKPSNPNILVFFKKSFLEIHQENNTVRVLELIEKKNFLVSRILAAHEENRNTQQEVIRSLTNDFHLDFAVIRDPKVLKFKKINLIIVVGGDGTILDISKADSSIPVLGVNSSPSTSTGHFCCATAANFKPVMEEILNGKILPSEIYRLKVTINGREKKARAMNDILFCHNTPGRTSNYIIEIGQLTESQKSSGIWICSGAGSTGATYSAGGEKMPIESRKIQFIVREPLVLKKRYELISGILDENQKVILFSKMITGSVFLDGHRTIYRVSYGDKIEVSLDTGPFRIFLPVEQQGITHDCKKKKR
jgi:NAD+ kinase